MSRTGNGGLKIFANSPHSSSVHIKIVYVHVYNKLFFKFALAIEEVKHSEWNKNMMIKKQWPTYSNSSDDCLEECPPCPDDACLGMCGFGCLCWKFICGDCCYHLGCYGHDMCCRQNFFDTQCLFPYGFVCDEDYYCDIQTLQLTNKEENYRAAVNIKLVTCARLMKA